ncbi:glycoside hydrolase family 13 protein [Desertivirga arenae]|uniref:glycoside hydrolase family 13 protein n=1 Tax=Desertivirga arenae TaxID=2810309 RepID=UPI001A96EA3F|nr:glycoside hydrolase family 13 protein [Pedobacter sp. SYSU D00823]
MTNPYLTNFPQIVLKSTLLKKIFCSLLLLCYVSAAIYAQIPALERVEPMFWWVGMKNPKLQLLVHGKNIAERYVSLNYPGVKLVRINKVENPNYLFIDLEVAANTKPGSFSIKFTRPGAKPFIYTYELKTRDRSFTRINGVTSKDLIYLIMPDRFANGDKSNDVIKGMRETSLNRDSMYYRHGGDLQGLIDHLDYLKDLGVTAIWMTPEIENDMASASYHGYAVTDHYKIDPRYGNNELYKKYVELCHSKGLKVIKDIVHNHTGTEHWFIKDMPMINWVHQWDKFTQTTYKDQTVMDPYGSAVDKKRMLNGWFVSSMPDLNQSNPFVQNYLNQNHIWWIEYAGIDGLRLDTYPYNEPAYMADWAKKLKAEFPRLSIFGETLVNGVVNQAYFTQGSTLNKNLDTNLPGITDVAVKDAIYEALNGKFDWTSGVNRLYSVLANDFIYQDPYRNVIFMDNHDMSRYYSMIGEDYGKYKSGLALLLTTRGIPQVYYGTELLMKNFSNPDGLVREDFKGGWEEDKQNKFRADGRNEKENEAFNYFRKLANYRKNTTALQTGKLMQYVPENGVYVFFRYNTAKTVMVLCNSNDKEITVETDRFSERTKGFSAAKNVLTDEWINRISNFKIPAKSTLVLELQK